jgi:hypothetical protein
LKGKPAVTPTPKTPAQTAADTKPPVTSVVNQPAINPANNLPTGTGFGDDAQDYSSDSLGNVYKTMPDGTYELVRAAEVADEYSTDSLGNVFKTMPDETSQLYRSANAPKNDTVGPLEANQVAALDAFEPQYFDDGQGNIYISTADGGYDLYRAADFPEDDAQTYTDPDSGDVYAFQDGEWVFQTSGNQENSQDAANAEALTYTDPDSGAVWTLGADGSWNTDYVEPYAPTLDSNFAEEIPFVDNEEEFLLEEKSGGLITMMKNGGGIQKYAVGGTTQNDDGTYNIEYGDRFETYDSSGRFLYTTPLGEKIQTRVQRDSSYGNNTSLPPLAASSAIKANPEKINSLGTQQDDEYRTDSLGNVFKNGEFYRAADVPEDTAFVSGGSNWYDNLGNLGKGALDSITGALGTTAGAAGAGALVATLLGSDFGGGGTQNEGLDMSKVGVINPRTTNFGVGPANFVGYDQYGTGGGDYTPNAELLKNLNAPGYNPVNEGDYGYEEPAPKMASGGLSSMSSPVASYYTFGQPADIMANLGMRPQPPMNSPDMMAQVGQQQPAQQAQQQGLPQQAPPMAQQQMSPTMPQQGVPQNGMMPQGQSMAPPMRKGGLPHFSDVPLVEGRMDFRNGSAVHGEGDGQSDDIPAMLADGEYVLDAELVSQIGNGSTKAGAQALDKFRENIRAHKRSAPLNKIPPKTKALTSYLKGAR